MKEIYRIVKDVKVIPQNEEVVEFVYCKYCKNYILEEKYCTVNEVYADSLYFCGSGERRKNES